MKLVRFGPSGQEKAGVIDHEGALRDFSGFCADINPDVLSDERLAFLAGIDHQNLPLVPEGYRTGPCVAGTGKFIAIGLNYSDHAKEANMEPPPEPIVFMKATSSICGPFDNIEIPKGSRHTDWEIELGVVIGKRAKYISEAEALDHVAGYCTVNDISERAFQAKRTGQWTKGKSHDTFGPIGPWLVTRDSVADPQALRLWCSVDGVKRQDGNTNQMIFPVAFLVHYLSQFMTLEPGDIIATGTPDGVGMGIKPDAVFLEPGQELRCAVDGLGEQCHVLVAA